MDLKIFINKEGIGRMVLKNNLIKGKK